MIIIPSQPVGRNQRRSSREDDKAVDSLDKMASYEDDVIEEEDSVEEEGSETAPKEVEPPGDG